MVAVRDRLPGPDVGRILRRHPETAALKTYLSTAPVDTQEDNLGEDQRHALAD